MGGRGLLGECGARPAMASGLAMVARGGSLVGVGGDGPWLGRCSLTAVEVKMVATDIVRPGN